MILTYFGAGPLAILPPITHEYAQRTNRVHLAFPDQPPSNTVGAVSAFPVLPFHHTTTLLDVYNSQRSHSGGHGTDIGVQFRGLRV